MEKNNTTCNDCVQANSGIVLACSGASDLGELTDKIARKLRGNKVYSMKCLAQVASDNKELIETLQTTDVLVIDGCPEDCGKKIMEEAWLSTYRHVRLTDFGYEKGKTTVTDELIDNVCKQVLNLQEYNIIRPTLLIDKFSGSTEKCDMFIFMAKYIGMNVLHPGGLKSTKRLLELLNLDKSKRVLDIACGKGTTSILIAKKIGCKVVGIDISEDSINKAKVLAEKSGVGSLVEFRVGDAINLPFADNEFDAIITQAMLVLVDEKEKAISEAMRVLKNGGKAGWIELTWKKQPSEVFIKQVHDIICAYCMLNVKDCEGWLDRFRKAGCNDMQNEIYTMHHSGIIAMLKDEGYANSLKILYKYISDSRVRKRINTMNRFFQANEDVVGYGIYTVKK